MNYSKFTYIFAFVFSVFASTQVRAETGQQLQFLGPDGKPVSDAPPPELQFIGPDGKPVPMPQRPVGSSRPTTFNSASSRAIDLNAQGADALAKNDPAAAAKFFSLAIQDSPSYVDAYVNRGVAENRQGQYDQAIVDYGMAIGLQPNCGAYYNRGNSRLNKGDATGSIADYSASMQFKQNPNDFQVVSPAGIFEARGTAKQVKGDFDGAADDYNQAIQMYGGENDESVRLFQAIVSRRLNRQNPMAGLAQSDNWKDAWSKMAASYLTGSLSEAAFLEQANNGDQNVVPAQIGAAQYYVGMTRLSQGDTAGARKAFQAVIDLNLKAFDQTNLARAELSRL